MDFTFYSKPEYFSELLKLIQATRSGDRIALTTMVFWPDVAAIQEIMQALCVAASRGAHITLVVDACTFLYNKHVQPGPLVFLRNLPSENHLPKVYRERLHALEQLKASGGRYVIINWPKRILANFFSGRSHIKCAIINDRVFIGGCNLNNVNDVDMMVGWQDKKIANYLHAFVAGVTMTSSVRKHLTDIDQTIAINETAKLLIDSGVPHQSVILDTAIRVIDEAGQYIILTCQYFPNDITIARLAAAQARGVNVKIIYNHPSKHAAPLNLLHYAVATRQRYLRSATFFAYQLPKSHDYIHAKLLVTEKTTVIGSHNLVKAGVDFGTAEIALVSQDPDFGSAALNALRRQLPTSITI